MFQMKLIGTVPATYAPRDLPELHVSFDDYGSILAHICDLLTEINTVSFVVHGFGENDWRVDVWVDLLTVLEQLPALYVWTSEIDAGSFSLDFYEQGTERRLVMSHSGEDVIIHGEPSYPPHSKWKPSVNPELLTRRALRLQVRELVTAFLKLARDVCPASVEHPWLVAHFAAVCDDNSPL